MGNHSLSTIKCVLYVTEYGFLTVTGSTCDECGAGGNGGLVLEHLKKLNTHTVKSKGSLMSLKDYRYHDFPNTEFSYFLTIDTKQYELSNYLLKNGVTGH